MLIKDHRFLSTLLQGLGDALGILQAHGCERVWVDGSFVTDKPDPGDFDCCFHAWRLWIAGGAGRHAGEWSSWSLARGTPSTGYPPLKGQSPCDQGVSALAEAARRPQHAETIAPAAGISEGTSQAAAHHTSHNTPAIDDSPVPPPLARWHLHRLYAARTLLTGQFAESVDHSGRAFAVARASGDAGAMSMHFAHGVRWRSCAARPVACQTGTVRRWPRRRRCLSLTFNVPTR